MAGEKEVKLFGVTRSPFVCRVRIALKLKGVEYKYFEEDLQNKSDQLLKYNPIYKKVPVLLHDEKPLSESLVILEYIDETWKANPILPADPYQRAVARFWAKFIEEKCVPAVLQAVWSTDKKEQEKGIEESLEALKILENELKDSKFFGGEGLGFVDIAAVLVAFWVPLLQDVGGLKIFTSEKFPKLYKWSQELLNHSVVKENLPPRDPVFAFYKSRHDSAFAYE